MKSFHRSPVFIVLLLAKLIIGSLFSSGYQDSIFIPFTKFFLLHGTNPWEHFLQTDPTVAFPYPPLMLYILSFFSAIPTFLETQNPLIWNFFLALPQLLADYLILRIMLEIFPKKKNLVLLFQWGSLIIFYVSYIHSQLDLIPTAFLFTSIWLLSRDEYKKSSLMLALSIATKSHTIIALPFIIIYLFRARKINEIALFIVLSIGISLILSMPFLWDSSYQFFVLHNKEQALIFEVYQRIGELKIFLAPLAIIMLLARFAAYRKINRDLLFSFMGMIFSVFVLFVIPTPAWYVWALPYLHIFYIKLSSKKDVRLVYLMNWVLSLSYLTYFIFYYAHPINPMPNIVLLGKSLLFTLTDPLQKNISFTILEGTLLATVYALFTYGVRSNSIYRKEIATVLGIGGDSGSGKTTLLNDLQALLGKNNTLILEGDADHKWERSDDNWKNITHLNPKANYLQRQAKQIELLKSGRPTLRGDYDHTSGTFLNEKPVHPNKYILIAGLHPFFLPISRKLIDLKIFMQPSEDLRIKWKLQRDIESRGHSEDYIRKQIESRRTDSARFVTPQREFSDLIFDYSESTDGNLELKTCCNMNVDLELLAAVLTNIPTLNTHHNYSDNLKTQTLSFIGNVSGEQIANAASSIIPNLEDIIPYDVSWRAGFQGIVQLTILTCISELLKDQIHEV